MSKTTRELEDLFAVRADFDSFISSGDEENARACVQTMGDMGEEFEALKMHRECNRAFSQEKDPWDAEQEQGAGRDADQSYEGSYKEVW